MSQCPHLDLASPETYIGGAPLEGYRALRRSQPVYWFEDKTLEPFWVVTGQEELDFISKHPLLFSSAEKTCFYHETEPEMLPLMRLMLINMDPPDHIKYRRIVRSAFTPKAMDAYESRFREIAKGLIDRVIDKGRCEFVEEVAAELPLVAICELMGIPIEDRKQFFEWTNIMLGEI
ncbi:MAG: cytochrome P450, partial [Spongiibacteraceae bacterium]|nr:cytochrome P450 [Spongiibacteraceae bacterium]